MKRPHCLAAFIILCASATSASAIDMPPPGAAACSGCHPTGRVETPVTRLTGRNPSDIVTAMQEFRSGQRPGTVMDRIAKGFTDDEIKAIAAWYAKQKD